MAPYVRAVAVAALNATLSGVWIAAGELTPARRRLVRAGALAVSGVVVLDAYRRAEQTRPATVVGVGENPRLVSEGIPRPPLDKRQAAKAAGLAGFALAVTVGRSRLRKRWLAQLTRDGHPHPTRVLAMRMAAFEFVVQLRGQVAGVRRDARAR
ncbi:hypothetical protein [Actinoplanes solisilvae]|uniref:hypothetical protein n=1 Tax=Actinoplanes solisilvae TaxID=2486853 RepID=UPI000FD74CB2|nr:hypothetical protein [Actinoplanes solisilvae]